VAHPRRFSLLCLFLIALLGVPALPAQEARWKQLNQQVLELNRQGKYAEAIPIATEAVKVAEAAFGPEDEKVGTVLNNLAELYESQGKYGEAEPLFQRALRICEKALGPDHPDLASYINNLAKLYKEQGKYDQAEPLYQRALRIREKALGPDDPDIATTLGSLAVLYESQGKYSEAEPLLHRALRIYEKALGPDDPDLATCVSSLATLYHDQGKYAEAESLYQRALLIREKALGLDHPDVANILNNLAALYNSQGKYAQAEPLLQRALHIWEKALGPDHPQVAASLNNLAVLYFSQGKYGEAEPFLQRALLIHEKALGPDHPDVAASLNNLSVLYETQGKYAEAEPLCQRALRIYEKALGPDHPDVATNINNLAALYEAQGKYAEAELLYQRAIKIREKALGPDHPDVATSLDSLAVLYRFQGKFGEAEPLFQRALRIYEKAFGLDHPDVAANLDNLAGLYYSQGKYGDAEPLFQRALRIREKVLGPDHPDVAKSLNNLAALYGDRGKYAQAEPLLQRALRICENTLGPDHPQVAASLNNLAALYFSQGKYGEAEPLLQRAQLVHEKALGPNHSDVALDLHNLAFLYVRQGKYAEAESLYQRALRIDEKSLGPEHSMVATILDNLATLYGDQGKYTEAEPLYSRAFDSRFQQFQYNFTYMSEKERLGFLGTVAGSFPTYFSFVYRFREKDPRLTGSMYNLLLWQKGLVAGSIANMRRDVEASGDKEALMLLNQLTAKRTQIATQLNANPPDRALWRKQIDQLQTEASEIEKALVARSSAFAERKKLERVTWQQVRDALQPGEAAVEFAHFQYFDRKWTDKHYYAALVVTRETRNQPEYIFLGDDKQIEGDAASGLQRAVQTRGIVPEQDAALPGSHAWELIWKPLEQALAGKTRIYLSPDGVLNEVPLGIVPAPDGKLQMERYDLRILSSTKDILRAAAPPAAATALLIGDPTFDLSEERQSAAMRKLSDPQPDSHLLIAALLPNDRSRDIETNFPLNQLPGTGVEVGAIAKLMHNYQWKTSTYTQDLALKRIVEQANSPRVVHLATHGFFLPDQHIETDRMTIGNQNLTALEDPMLRSGLYFAGASRTLAGNPVPEDLDNGVLTAMEAGNLNLRGTELVVLSACNTGQGDVKNGEGVFGLRRALEEAGAQAVMMSLWSVPDIETQELMTSFYSKWLSGMEKHEALKQAQLEIRDKVRRAHEGRDLPYYWGAFVLVGR